SWPGVNKNGKTADFDKHAYYKHYPCKDLAVLRRKPQDPLYRTEYPVLDSDHNVYDFPRMCRNVFKDMKPEEYGPYYKNKMIASIECLPHKDNQNKDKTGFSEALANQNTVVYTDGSPDPITTDAIEITC
ncbi:hypothetical protein PENTCL1PPCAC_1545, partial [Pristionchus entomophagus]